MFLTQHNISKLVKKWKVKIMVALTTNPKFWSTSHSVTWPNFLNRLLISSLVVPSISRPTNILVGISYSAHTTVYKHTSTTNHKSIIISKHKLIQQIKNVVTLQQTF